MKSIRISGKPSRRQARRQARLKSPRTAYMFVHALIFALGLSALIVNAANDSANDSISDSAEFDSMADTSSQIEVVPRKTVYILKIEDAIGVVTVKRIKEAIELAEDENAELIVIMLDTPGGFTKATWAIDKAILNSHVPIVVYIAPSGARAGSAGVYITYAANFAVMAPGTNIGAAHPVSGSGEKIDSLLNEKITNDAVASIKAMAEKRGRNAEWAERSVRESVSITDLEADSLGVINFRAHALADLYDSLDGRVAETPSGEKTLDLSNVEEITLVESFLERVLKVIASPDIAFLLFSIGGLGIVLELYHPGAILPGVVGGISLILAFYAFQTLPINTTGLML
ncbi:MAG: nodulation protein NfeD, partial [candidate division Zixibacteria bacterium]|nr:nodulation protein NfeD [candidate division Zixibacteria bacterium]